MSPSPSAVAPHAGISLKPQHYREILDQLPDLGFCEIHAENYMGSGGPPHHYLARIRDRYPLSLHGVALSIGGSAPLDAAHLSRLRALIDRYRPGLFSEHLAWSTHDGAYLDDLLPVPYTEATLDRVCRHVEETQDVLGRRMLLENPSTYIQFDESAMTEIDFLRAIVERTGCGLLLDVNNVFVSAINQSYDATAYIDAFPLEHVGEIHLAGHDARLDDIGAPLLIDAHGSPVADPVWMLYEHTIRLCGPVPTLIERDANVPPLAELVAEAGRAEAILRNEARRRQRVLDAAE
jgi:uncharacterized protein (UPF0276 family)